jgi:hypothetical protein
MYRWAWFGVLMASLLLSGATAAWAGPAAPPVKVPEPGTLALFGMGVAGLLTLRRILIRGKP